ncbi:MAG: hypothetical protein ABEI52_12790, partial [Halobacteriaceae archaeon]
EGLNNAEEGLRNITCLANEHSVPTPVLSQTLNAFDSLRHERLPSASITQAMRDYFGSHTYRRVDEDGDYHTLWNDDKTEITKEDTTEYYQKKAKEHR